MPIARRARKTSPWDRVAAEYDLLYSGDWSKEEDRELASWVRSITEGMPQHLRVLDIGCGTGLGYQILQTAHTSIDYIGVDSSLEMLRSFNARSQASAWPANIRLKHMAAEDIMMEFRGNPFDFIMLTNTTASYVKGPTSLLRNCRQLLAPRGAVFASFLNRASLRRQINREVNLVESYRTRGAGELMWPVSALAVSEEELRRRCSRAGLTLGWIRYQSVLGGVMERPFCVEIERVLRRIIPGFGHSINLYATR